MLLAAFVILVNALRSAAHMLVKVKRLEVRAAKRPARRANQQTTTKS